MSVRDFVSIQEGSNCTKDIFSWLCLIFSMLPILGMQDSPVSKFEFILLSDINFLYHKNIQGYSNDNICFLSKVLTNTFCKERR